MPQDIGIDLGTASVLVYIKGKGIVLKEPSVVAVDTTTNKLLAVGKDAQRMLGRTPGNIVAIRPLRDGVISDYHMTERMLKYFLEKVCKRQLFKPRVIICVPSGVTEVEERAVMDAASQAGASKTYLIEEPVAAAIGANIDIGKPYGNMVVDIGGGTSDIAVISLGGIVESNSIKVAGDKFDEAIIKYIRKKHNILVGERTAQVIKEEIGCVYPREDENGKKTTLNMDVRGRCLITGLPKTVTVTSEEMREALEESAMQIVEAIKNLLEITPPELVGDISSRGIVLTGGGSLIWGLDKLIHQETSIACYIADDPISCVAIGTGKALDNIESLKDTTDKH
ncbi:MAG: rod shape-determining protein MreB [Clostridiales bacterium]|jgi:rod shape-determining protein MreB|nr:rod shape-determining protein MreB [Clostridiales bacterium]